MQDASLNIFDLIDTICKNFGSEWQSDKRPRIEAWLDQVPYKTQPSLFRNLLDIEIKYRYRLGESLSSAEYIKRFPGFSRQVRQVFDESTLGSLEEYAESISQNPAGARLVRGFGFQAASKLGEYELTNELGRGGFGVVYEARHLKRNNRVALKTLPTGVDGQEVNADRLHKFRREFRSLSEINHPNLVGMQTLEVDGDQWFFTMDLVEGTDFLSYVRPGGDLNESRLRESLQQLAAGIIALHEVGIVHRDLKPSNVMVEMTGRVVILDFGLVAQLQSKPEVTVAKSGMFAGTPKYAAPEQMFGQRSEASDWYAFGTMLYESLKGQAPFPEGQMDLMRLKQEERAPSIAGHKAYPQDLALLADRLLDQNPDSRPSTLEIVDVLRMNVETGVNISTYDAGDLDHEGTGRTSRSQGMAVELFGREEQLEQMQKVSEQFLKNGVPQLVWISGLSGEGKSSLTESFLDQMQREGETLVFAGRCYDRESVPFKA